MGERPQQQDHRARRHAGFGELAQPCGERPGLRHPALRGVGGDGADQGPGFRLAPALRVGQQQLDRRSIGAGDRERLAPDAQRREVPEQLGADQVDRGDHVGGGAEAAGQPEHRRPAAGRQLVAHAAEAVEVGAAEGVDRLGLVADGERAGLRAGEQSHELDLDRARVLELVDEQVVEALALGLERSPGLLRSRSSASSCRSSKSTAERLALRSSKRSAKAASSRRSAS